MNNKIFDFYLIREVQFKCLAFVVVFASHIGTTFKAQEYQMLVGKWGN